MIRPIVERALIERRLAAAIRTADELMPFSPSWDAAMAHVEDLERELWHRRTEDAAAATALAVSNLSKA